MDPQIRWLRRRILIGLVPLALGWFVAGSLLAFALATILTDAPRSTVVPASIAAGLAVVLLGMARAALTNPLSYPYLRSHLATPRRYELSDEPIDDDLVEVYEQHRLYPLVTMGERGHVGPSIDLFQTPKQTLTVARDRRTGAVSVLSKLDDDRILLTDSLLTVSSRRLLVNPATATDVNGLVAAHQDAVAAMKDRGARVVPDDGFVFIEALAHEHDGLVAVGPLLGPFLNLGSESRPLRFLPVIDRGAFVERALAGSAAASPSTSVGAR